jgi:hypothetical protein
MEQVPFFDQGRKGIEDLFFVQQDKKIIAQLRALEALKETKEELAKVSGIKDEAVLQKLVELNIRPETLAALSLIPLIEIAWADGKVDEKEKDAMLKAAEAQGLDSKGIAYSLLKQWMTHKPGEKMMSAWEVYVQALCKELGESEKEELKAEVLGHARVIAQASGGFLGLGSKISKSEEAVLQKLEAAFSE